MQLLRSMRENLRKYGFNSIFVRILALILAVCVVFNLALGIYYYRKTYERVRQEVLISGEESLKRISETIDETYSYIYSTLFTLTSGSGIKSLATGNYTDTYTKLMMMKAVVGQFAQIVADSSFLNGMYLYLPAEARILSDREVARVSAPAYADMASLLEAFLTRGETGVRTAMTEEAVPRLGFYVNLPLTAIQKTACLAFFVDMEALREYCMIRADGLADAIDVRDQQGNSLFSIRSETAPDDLTNPGAGYIVIRQQGAVSGLTVAGMIHQNTLTGYLSSFAGALILAMALFTLLLIALSYAVALRLYAPYASLSAKLAPASPAQAAGGDDNRNELAFIDQNLNRMLNHSDHLNQIVEDNLGMIRAGYILGLLRGAADETRETIERKARLYRMQINPFSPMYLMMFLFTGSESDESSVSLEVELPVLIELVRSRFPKTECLAYKNDAMLALVSAADAPRLQTRGSIFDQVRSLLKRENGPTCRVLCTGICADIFAARATFSSLRSAMDFGFALPPWTIEETEELAIPQEDGRAFVIDAKDKIRYFCSQADAAGACRVVNELYSCVSAYAKPTRLLDFFFAQMISTLEFDYVKGESMPDSLKEQFQKLYSIYCSRREYYDIKICLEDILRALCNSMKESRVRAHGATIKAAKEYIKAHYMEDISLDNVAEAAGLSAGYFSKVFADAEGIVFKEYLTRERVERASRLLIENTRTIGEIMTLCGFTNSATFYRVFKRYTGHSPRQYCELFGARHTEQI